MNTIIINGVDIYSVEDFHNSLKNSSHFPSFYGRNYSALWDALTGLVERPLKIVWRNASISRNRLGDDYGRLISMMREVEDQTRQKQDRFELVLED